MSRFREELGRGVVAFGGRRLGFGFFMVLLMSPSDDAGAECILIGILRLVL